MRTQRTDKNMASESQQDRCSTFAIRLLMLFALICACIFVSVYFSPSLSPVGPKTVNMSVISDTARIPDLTNWTDDVVENRTEYGCGNARFTVQEWTMVNLPIAAVIILFFGFFQPRTRLWPGCCSGRPSVAYPVNLLDSYSDRLAFVCAFGITCIGILDLFTGNYYVEPNYDDLPEMVRGAVRSCMAYVNVFAIGLAHYPIMICLTVQAWVVSDVIGILYTLEWAFFYYYSLAECPWGESDEGNVNNLILLPIYLCYIILLVLFIKRMYKNYTIRKKVRQGLEVEIHDYEEDFVKTHFYQRVKYLLTPKDEWERNKKEPGSCRKFWNRFYEDEPGFRFSRRIICTIALSGLCLFCIGIIYEASGVYLERWAAETFIENGSLYNYLVESNSTDSFYTFKEIADSFAYSFSPTTFVAMGVMICYNMITFIAYRRNTLRLWRGDKSFCPKEDFANTTLVVCSLKYSGYHIAFVLWGFILLQLTLWLLTFLTIYLLVLPIINKERNWVWTLIRNQWLSVVVYMVVYYSQVISAKFLFLQQRGKELSIDNRRLFHVQVYFFFFVNVIIGLASCLLRIFKSVLFGLLLVGRIDRCLLMRGFELYDSGYKAYLGFLQLEVAHTHPIVITFCHYLLKTQRDRKEKVFEFTEDEEVDIPIPKRVNVRARNRWYLVYTLIRNHRLLAERFDAILSAKRDEVKRQIEEEKQKKDEKVVKEAVTTFINDDVVESDGVREENSKAKVVSVTSSTAKIEDERETNLTMTSDYDPSSGASHSDSSPLPRSGSPTQTWSTISILESPQITPSPFPVNETKADDGIKDQDGNTMSSETGSPGSNGSQASLIKHEDEVSNSSVSPLVIEDEEMNLPGTPIREQEQHIMIKNE
ncbi:stimulated by retinoic acid gene 6 protein-like isoform X1 [Lytechinus variegatus]|uniref:stimulated by retinoic acid gene 6 protein-like isoform X1 n=1 Tax=Lytechinus variegatus TaxID=7654 RepID=UPI001BB10C4A|nr:stimulated by retinoic acid gene 6 protein-like isoform X1 [Lytechinus variegatus]